jgi:SpoVK/Ycf46/Vps4 family AAA+-type ATPase
VGPPGTGKTMAATVIANELGRSLFCVDPGGVMSKYIGETEENLDDIFQLAEANNAVLLFDEAEALFGKRDEVGDGCDRYASLQTSGLLRRLEAFSGLSILATNKRANIDDAFVRRLYIVVDFPIPSFK